MAPQLRASLDHPRLIEPDRQGSRGGDLRILLPNGSGGGVARVGEETVSRLALAPVELLERLVRHVDLSAHLEQRRGISQEAEGNGIDRPEVGGHVLSDRPVAPRRPPDEDSVLVGERHREAVDLQLAHVAVGRIAELTGDALLPRPEIVGGLGVVERAQRSKVLDRGEHLRRRSADTPGRRVGCDEVRVTFLELHQLGDECVVLGIGDLGIVEDVVAMGVVPDPLAQLLHPLRGCAHGRSGAASADDAMTVTGRG